jgi:ribonuclease BN (tRNA processing enzyme)
LCENEYTFTSLGEAKVKGKKHPIQIYRPEGTREGSAKIVRNTVKTKNSIKAQSQNAKIIGREREIKVIRSMIEKMVREGEEEAGIVVVEADSGQGLSTLMSLTRQEALNRGVIMM